MKQIKIKYIDHGTHRYPTVGDYWYEGKENVQQVRISKMRNPDYEFLVTIHELIEAYLCRRRGIAEPDIKAFDEAYEANRQPGDNSEPGNHPDAPYKREHEFATYIEELIAKELDVDWESYSKVIDSL